jgi:integrase
VTVATPGIGRGEVCGLKWSDVNLDYRHITVRRSRVPVAGEVVDSTPKNGRVRVVALGQLTVKALKHQRKIQTAAKLKPGAKWQGRGDYVFIRPFGRTLKPNSLSRELLSGAKVEPTRGIKPRILLSSRVGSARVGSIWLAAQGAAPPR